MATDVCSTHNRRKCDVFVSRFEDSDSHEALRWLAADELIRRGDRDFVVSKFEDFTFDADPHQMQWAFRANRQRVWHVEPAYTESIYSTVMSGTIVVRATETSFGIDVSRDGPPPTP